MRTPNSLGSKKLVCSIRPMVILAFILILVSVLAFAHRTNLRTTNTMAKNKLVIGILTVESSYAQSIERPSRGVPDTVQFWINPGQVWRIKTYATDHDIHIYDLGDLGKMKDCPTEFAQENIQKHYGDVLASSVVLEFPDVTDTNAVRRVLAQHRLNGSLEVAKAGFAFWNPDDGHYTSKTTPR